MKQKLLLLALTLTMLTVCFSAVMGIVTYAEEASGEPTQDGLMVSLISDKESYDLFEDIAVTLTVKNTSETNVSNVSLENVIPDGYELAGGCSATKQVDTLQAGETVTLSVTYVPGALSGSQLSDSDADTYTEATADVVSASSAATTSNESSGQSSGFTSKTGVIVNILVWIALLVLACGVIVAVILLKKKSAKKLLSLFLCIAMLGTIASGMGISVKAEEFQSNSITVSLSVTVDDSDLEISATVTYGDEKKDTDTDQDIDEDTLSRVQEFCGEGAELIDVIDAENSGDVPTEAEVIEILEERGFSDYPVTYEYSIDGEYLSETEVSADLTDKHPMYQTYYRSESGEIWTIFVINGQVIANPALFNLESDLSAQLLVSESEQLTSYDSEFNKFYITIPGESAVIVKTVERINAETLDMLTSEEIESL